jgi:hypothetical protein
MSLFVVRLQPTCASGLRHIGLPIGLETDTPCLSVNLKATSKSPKTAFDISLVPWTSEEFKKTLSGLISASGQSRRPAVLNVRI